MSSAESLLVQQTFEQIERELGAGMVPRLFQLLEPHPRILVHLWGQFRATILHGHFWTVANLLALDPSRP